MRRRELVSDIVGAVLLWPVATRAQKSVPVIGFLNSASPDAYKPMNAGFHTGLREGGFDLGRDVTIESRWAEGRYDRLPAMAAELVARKAAVIVASGSAAPALAAKAATAEIPIVFISGSDPVRTGLVPSLNHPGGNITGVSITFTSLVPKRLELLYLLVPDTARLGALVNPITPKSTSRSANWKKRQRQCTSRSRLSALARRPKSIALSPNWHAVVSARCSSAMIRSS